MNAYEGLNLPELLALMHEIVLPDAISRMPEGPGWWILFAWLVACSVIFARYLLLRRKANAYRREATVLLRDIAADKSLSGAQAAEQIAILVKRTALAAYPRETVVAERFEAMVSLGLLNSRMKDYFDLHHLATTFAFAGEPLSRAVRGTFERCQTELSAALES